MCIATDKENTHEKHDRSTVSENIVELRGDWEAFADEIRGTLPISLMCRNADAPWEPNGRNHDISAGLQRLQSLCFTPETKAIAPWHFYGCCSLMHLLLPDRLEKIGAGAFANCTALEEVVIPESVTEIEPKAFFKCTALRRVQISDALLHTLDDSVFALTPWMQMRFPAEPLHRPNDVLVVSLGNGANEALLAFAGEMEGNQDLLVVNESQPEAFWLAKYHAVFLPKEKTALFKSRFWAIQPKHKYQFGRDGSHDPMAGIELLLEAEKRICSVLQQYRLVIIVAALGGCLGSHASLLAQWLRKMDLPYAVVINTPFRFEGRRKLERAQEALSELEGDPVMVVSEDLFKKRCAERETKLTLLNAFSIVNGEIICQIRRILAQKAFPTDFCEQLTERSVEMIEEIENTMLNYFQSIDEEDKRRDEEIDRLVELLKSSK